MILTVTMNSSIDKLYLMESIQPETVMRVKEVHNTAGGKGLNVSKVAAKLGEPVTAMGFIAHHDDVSAGGQGRIVFLELLHGGEDDAVGRAAFKQLAQMFPCGGLHRLLTQEVLALGELTIKLIVEVVTVGDDHDGRL